MPIKAFVLMPFAPDFDDVFEHIIRTPLEAAGFSVSRADEVRGSRSIMHDVVQGIVDAELIIADLTGANPNVYYELGIAHALRKKVVLLAQDLEEVPFDLRAYRVITYSTHFARVADAAALLKKVAAGAQDGTMQFGSPVSDFGSPSHTSISATAGSLKPTINSISTHDEDYGSLDVIVDMQEGMEAIGKIIGEVGIRLSDLNPKIEHAGQQMLGALKHNPTQMRELIRSLATEMDDYSRWLRSANSSYRDGLTQLTSGLDALFTSEIATNSDSKEQMPQFAEMLAKMEGTATDGRESMLLLLNVLDTLPRIEKEFNRAKRRFAEETHSLVGNVDQTISVIARARIAANLSSGVAR